MFVSKKQRYNQFSKLTITTLFKHKNNNNKIVAIEGLQTNFQPTKQNNRSGMLRLLLKRGDPAGARSAKHSRGYLIAQAQPSNKYTSILATRH